jgi:CheY-like chemotaxis protein
MPIRQPGAAAPSRAVERRDSARPTGRRVPTVLVLDGDEALRDAVSLQLRSLGYGALEAKDAAQALQLFLDGHKVDLLLTEAAVPGMACTELLDAVRALKPDLPFIIMSNRLDAARASRPDCLRKPFKVEQLKDKLDAALGARAAGRRAG